jgi:hypothetical protein
MTERPTRSGHRLLRRPVEPRTLVVGGTAGWAALLAGLSASWLAWGPPLSPDPVLTPTPLVWLTWFATVATVGWGAALRTVGVTLSILWIAAVGTGAMVAAGLLAEVMITGPGDVVLLLVGLPLVAALLLGMLAILLFAGAAAAQLARLARQWLRSSRWQRHGAARSPGCRNAVRCRDDGSWSGETRRNR